jgi:hypothetical protein
MLGGLGGMFAAMPQGVMSGYNQTQQMADELLRRRQLLFQFQQEQQNAPLQRQYLQAQIAHMNRPDVAAQKWAAEQQAAIAGMQAPPLPAFPAQGPYAGAGPGVPPIPGAQPMPQPPQGVMPPQAPPVPVQTGAVQPGMRPSANAQPGAMPQPGAPTASPGTAGMIRSAFPNEQPGLTLPPQGQAGGLPQQPGLTLPPQGQAGGLPQQPDPAGDINRWEQQAMTELQQRARSMPPSYANAIAIQQQQDAIQKRAQELRADATAQFNARKEQETERFHEATETWRDKTFVQRGGYQDRSLDIRESAEARKNAMDSWRRNNGDERLSFAIKQGTAESSRKDQALRLKAIAQEFEEHSKEQGLSDKEAHEAWLREFRERGLSDKEANAAWSQDYKERSLEQRGSIAERNADIREKHYAETGQRADARMVRQREEFEKRLALQSQLAELNRNTRTSEGAKNRSAADLRAAKQRLLTERDADEKAYVSTMPTPEELENYKQRLNQRYQAELAALGGEGGAAPAAPSTSPETRAKIMSYLKAHSSNGTISREFIGKPVDIDGKKYKLSEGAGGSIDFEELK